MAEYTAKVHKNYSYNDESLWLYKNGRLINHISIDRSCDALYWCNRFEMQRQNEKVVAENGEQFHIYRNDKRNLICAIPA